MSTSQNPVKLFTIFRDDCHSSFRLEMPGKNARYDR
jgi:hypothetical protein